MIARMRIAGTAWVECRRQEFLSRSRRAPQSVKVGGEIRILDTIAPVAITRHSLSTLVRTLAYVLPTGSREVVQLAQDEVEVMEAGELSANGVYRKVKTYSGKNFYMQVDARGVATGGATNANIKYISGRYVQTFSGPIVTI